MGFGTFLKGTIPGLAQTGLGIATGNPFLIGSGAAGALGGGLAAAGSRTRMNGPTDAEIAQMLGASRRSQSAQIAAGERAGARQVASQAAQGGTLESGLAGRGFQDVRGAAGMQRAAMEADLSRQGMAALASRTYSPDVTPLGAAGMALTQIASPIQQLGMNILTQKYLPKEPETKPKDLGGGAPSTSGGNAAGGAPTSTASQAPPGPPRGGAPLPLAAQASQGLGGMVPAPGQVPPLPPLVSLSQMGPPVPGAEQMGPQLPAWWQAPVEPGPMLAPQQPEPGMPWWMGNAEQMGPPSPYVPAPEGFVGPEVPWWRQNTMGGVGGTGLGVRATSVPFYARGRR